MDFADQATELEEHNRSLALAGRVLPSPLPSLEQCERCGSDIPLARQKAVHGVATCAPCQSELEKIYRGVR